MTTMAIAASGLRDGTQYVLVTCACGFQSPARSLASAQTLQTTHQAACDWTAPSTPNGARGTGVTPSYPLLTTTAIAAVLGVPGGIVAGSVVVVDAKAEVP